MSLYFFQNVQPKQGTPGVEQPAPSGGQSQAAPPPGGNLMMLLIPLIFIPIFLLQSRRQKKENEARKNLKKGDKVVTQGGLIGELVETDERTAKVKIAPGTTVQVLASSVSAFDTAVADAKGKTDKELADLKEAKATADKK